MDGGDDEVDLEELGGQAYHQEEGEEGDEEHLGEKSCQGSKYTLAIYGCSKI